MHSSPNLRAPATCAIALVIAASISACGGGGSSEPVTSPTDGSGITVSAAPASQTVVEGQQVTLTVTASAASALSYQWRKNGADIPGATAATYLTPTLATSDDNAGFSVHLTANGQSTDATATVRVLADTAVPAPTAITIKPSSTDPAVADTFGDHYIYLNPAVTAKGRLFVFLPASGGSPSGYSRVGASAAANGMHSIGLSYANDDVVALLCSGLPGSCQGDIREETLTGGNASSEVNVTPANGIENRLAKLLKALAQQRSAEGWGQFLDANGAVRWDLVRMSGHSQGGGMAAYVGVKRVVDRVCTFSSPADYVSGAGRPADWLFDTPLTSASRFYGFGDTKDDIVPWSNLQQIWAALKMNQFGSVTNVDTTPAPYNGSHMLYTDVASTGSGAGSGEHSLTVANTTPLDANGLPVFRRVWQVACFL